jgi:virginiamycin B lyase
VVHGVRRQQDRTGHDRRQHQRVPDPDPQQPAAGYRGRTDGALWFTELAGNKVGRISTAGAIAEFAIPTPDSGPWGITAGPDGAMWFTESAAVQIGRISVRPATKGQCRNGGWRRFPGFRNQGDCVSFVATGGKNPPAGG